MNSPPLSVSNPTRGNGNRFSVGHRLDDPPVGTVLHRHVLRPPGEHVRDAQGVNKLAPQACPAVQHQVCFNKPWCLFMFITGFGRSAFSPLEWSNASVSFQQRHREFSCHGGEPSAKNAPRAPELEGVVAVGELGYFLSPRSSLRYGAKKVLGCGAGCGT